MSRLLYHLSYAATSFGPRELYQRLRRRVNVPRVSDFAELSAAQRRRSVRPRLASLAGFRGAARRPT